MEKRLGIRSLIPTGTLTEAEGTIQEVPVEHLKPSSYQPRTTVKAEALAELVESIKIHGIIQPLVARRVGQRLELIAGERRLRAAKQAGLARVPVLIREAGNQEMLELALVENLQREDINPMEAAEAYRRLADEFGMTQEQVAARVGKSRSAVANSLRLLHLPTPVRESLRSGQIDEGHGKALASISEERTCLQAWRRVVKKGLSVRETEATVAKLLGRDVPRGTSPYRHSTTPPLDPNLLDLVGRISDHLGARVSLKQTQKGGGVIEIAYTDADDLDRVFWQILGVSAAPPSSSDALGKGTL